MLVKTRSFTPTNPLSSCPYLGLYHDSATCYSYPVGNNFCHASGTPKRVDLDRQAGVCLTQAYINCPVPLEVQNTPVQPPKTVPTWLKLSLGAVLIALIAWLTYTVGYPLLNRPAALPALTETAETTWTAIPTASATSQPEFTATILAQVPVVQTATDIPPTLTATLAPTRTPRPATATAGPIAGTPFGSQKEYIIHVIQEAESLSRIADLYNSSVHVLWAANEFEPGKALWPGQLIVVLPNVTDPEGVTRFRIVELNRRMEVDDLAIEYGVTTTDLRHYNSLGTDPWVPAGRVLIVPVE